MGQYILYFHLYVNTYPPPDRQYLWNQHMWWKKNNLLFVSYTHVYHEDIVNT